MGQGNTEGLQAIDYHRTYEEVNARRDSQVKLLDYLNISLCECEKPANFTIFVARLRNEILNGKLI